MNISAVKGILKAAYLANDTVIMEGKHGLGKSQVAGAYAKEENFNFVPLFLSHMEMGDVLGLPRTAEVGGVLTTTWSAPDWINNIINSAFPASVKFEDLTFEDKALKSEVERTLGKAEINRADLNNLYTNFYELPRTNELYLISNQTNVTYSKAIPSVLLLDELNRAALDVRQGTMQLILEKELHTHKLPYINGRQTQIIAAINPADDYQVDELDPALLDRFLHVTVEADATSWLAWARESNINHIVRDFIAENKNKLHFTPSDGKTGASPRSWAKLAAFVDIMDTIAPELHHPIMNGKIGSALASQFLVFYNNYSKNIGIKEVEKEIAKAKKKNSDIEAVGAHIAKFLENQEVVQRSEMAHAFLDAYITKTKSDGAYPLLAYLYSLPLELRSSFLKDLKASSMEHYTKLAKFDGELNGKKLFLSIVNVVYDNN